MLVIAALLASGCTGQPKWRLTDNEKAKAIEIALSVPEVSRLLEKESKYKAEVSWIAIVWNDSEVVEWWALTNEQVEEEKGIPRFVAESAVLYSRVLIRFGEPERTHVIVAVDLDKEGAVFVQKVPARGTAGPTPSPLEGIGPSID